MDKISIVTVCYNAEKEIADTMDSVYQQTYANIEYIIIDGLSKDNTLNIIKKKVDENRSKIKTIVISEQDRGIYDAMNKGIAIASGEWILFMNAGDFFYDSMVVSKVFCKEYKDEIMGIFGDTERFCGDYKKVIKAKPLKEIKDSIPMPFCHQSVFVRTDIMKKSYFDVAYKQAADYNFFLHCFLEGYKFVYVDNIISKYAMGGISETNTVLHLSEKIKIRETVGVEHYGLVKKNYMLQRLKFKQMIKKILPRKVLILLRGY